MPGGRTNRRAFLRDGIAAGAGAGLAFSRVTASSYGRVIGANDRVNLGLIGCGGRGQGIFESLVKPANANAALAALNRCYDVVKSSKLAVQNGSQGVSCPGARAVKQFIAAGKLGKLFRIESTESLPAPYWMYYRGPKTAAETDWNAFLCNREHRPFDAHQHASWMGYHDFSSGAIGGWMSHFINFVHFVTGCGFPVAAAAFGGEYASTNDPRCDAPDQVTVILEYAEGFHTQFVSHFGSSINSETTLFMFEKGSLRTRFGHHIGKSNLVRSADPGPARSRGGASCFPDKHPPARGASVPRLVGAAGPPGVIRTRQPQRGAPSRPSPAW